MRFFIISLVTFSSVTFAASKPFQASVVAFDEAIINESNPLHFGTILTNAGASCSLDSSGSTSGSCASVDANIAVGVINLSGLVANQSYQIEVVGSDNGIIRFSPAISVNSIETFDDDSNQVVSTTTTPSTSDTDIVVFGSLEVLSQLTAGATYNANYTVNVSFQ